MERTLITVPTAIPMVALVGPADKNLREIESAFPNVSMTVRGNEIALDRKSTRLNSSHT